MNYAEYQASTDPNKFLDGCPCISCAEAKVRARNLEESMRTTINAERGLAPAPKLDLQGNPTDVDWRKKLEELLPFMPVVLAPTPDMQKNLRDYRESMGNPLPPADASPRPLSAVEAMLNNDTQKKSPDYLFPVNMNEIETSTTWTPGCVLKVDDKSPMRLTIDYKKLLEQVQWPSQIGFCDNGPCAHEKCPSCKNWIATHGYKIGEERRKEGGYATLMTNREVLRAFNPELFPETPEETEKRRDREWAECYRILNDALRTEQENYEAARAEREKEQRIRRNERLRIASLLEDETLKPAHRRRSRTQTIALIRSL